MKHRVYLIIKVPCKSFPVLVKMKDNHIRKSFLKTLRDCSKPLTLRIQFLHENLWGGSPWLGWWTRRRGEGGWSGGVPRGPEGRGQRACSLPGGAAEECLRHNVVSAGVPSLSMVSGCKWTWTLSMHPFQFPALQMQQQQRRGGGLLWVFTTSSQQRLNSLPKGEAPLTHPAKPSKCCYCHWSL